MAHCFETVPTQVAAQIRDVPTIQIHRLVAAGLHPPPLQDQPGGVQRHIKGEQFEMLRFLAAGLRSKREIKVFVDDLVRRRSELISRAETEMAAA